MQVLSQMFTKHISKVLVLIQEKMYAALFAHYTHTRATLNNNNNNNNDNNNNNNINNNNSRAHGCFNGSVE